VLTAGCAGTGAVSGLFAPTLNVAVVSLFLEQFYCPRLTLEG
jgi:hypothetical protein